MRRRGKIDATQTAIVGAARALGWVCRSLASVGDGMGDVLAAKGGRLELWEIKDGSKPPSARQLTADEAAYHAQLAAVGVDVRIVGSVEDVVTVTLGQSRHSAPRTA